MSFGLKSFAHPVSLVLAPYSLWRRSRPVLARVLAIFLLASSIMWPIPAAAAEKVIGVSWELREQAISVLRQALRTETRWSKVHVAEYLLALDYVDNIGDVFAKELAAHEREPEYRVGIWRVLVRAADSDTERNHWIEKIRQVAFDARAKDRLHALESLAKLGYRVSDGEAESLQEAGRPDRGAATAYARWVLANSGRADGEARMAILLASPDPDTRAIAGYAFQNLQIVSREIPRQLAAAAEREAVDSPARAPLIGAAAMHASGEQRQAFRRDLLSFATPETGKHGVVTAQILAQIGDDSDLPLLRGFLTAPDPDLRAVAAYAILRIDRRQPHHLVAWDWLVIAVYVLGMLSVGWYYSRRNSTREEYLLGGRKMRPLSVGVSLFASLISTISYLAWPGEVIKNGPMMLSSFLACPLIAIVVGWFMIPFVMRLKVTSAYEILELRLGIGVRLMGSLMFLLLRFLWMAVIIYATTSKVLVPLLGLDPRMTPLVCVLLGAITVVYTTMGGLRAVVLTDVIQSGILFGAAITTLIVVTVSLGGVNAWWPQHWAAHWQVPVYGYDSTARVTVFGAILASLTWSICTSGSDQIAIQRYLATRDAKTARTVLNISLAADVLVALLLAGVGLGLLAYYRARPFLLPDGQTVLTDADKLFPRFIVVGLPVGVSGLVVAGLLAAAMSALSAGVNSTCSVITVDFLDRFRRKHAPRTESTNMRQVKWVSAFVGVVVVALSLFVNMVQGNLIEIAYKVVNLFTAPLFGLFFMAMFVRWATGFGTLVGAACGLATAIAVCYWPELTGSPGISFLWAMPLSLLVEISVASLASLLPVGRAAAPLDEVV
jgi:solute:Na+ symporter, SSS family